MLGINVAQMVGSGCGGLWDIHGHLGLEHRQHRLTHFDAGVFQRSHVRKMGGGDLLGSHHLPDFALRKAFGSARPKQDAGARVFGFYPWLAALRHGSAFTGPRGF